MIQTDLNTYQRSINNIGAKNPLLKTWLRLIPPPRFGEISDPKGRIKNSSFAIFQKSEELEFKYLNPVLNNTKTNILVLFGCAYGIYYKKIKPWLAEKRERRLLIFEDQADQLQNLLATSEGFELSLDEKVDLFYLKIPHFWEQNSLILRQKLSSAFSILAIESYRKNRSTYFRSLKNKLLQIGLDQNALIGEYLASPQLYENALNNFNLLQSAKLLPSIYNEFENIPAIICGAGPSMGASAETFKFLRSKALILAGGNALSVLSHACVEPHISVGIDPNPTHEETFSKNNSFHLPFIYRARVHHNVLKKAHGELLYVPQAVGYPYVKWLEENLDVQGSAIDEGHNVINFSLMLAIKLGCNPIILIGCDLAYQGNDSYDKTCASHHPMPQKGVLNPYDFSIHRGFYKKSNSNKKVYTLWKWTQEAKWISQLAQKNPNKIWINSSKDGLKIDNLNYLPLEKIEKKYLRQDYDIDSILHQSIQLAHSIPINDQKKRALFKETEKSLLKCKTLLKEITSNKDTYLACEGLLEQEVAYQEILYSAATIYKDDELDLFTDKIKRKQKRATFLLSLTQSYLDVFRSAKNQGCF